MAECATNCGILAEVRSQLAEIRGDVKEAVTGLNGLSEQVAVLAARFDGADRRLAAVEPRVEGLAVLATRFDATDRALTDMRPRLEALEAWRAWSVGAAAGVAALAGGFSGIVARMLGH